MKRVLAIALVLLAVPASSLAIPAKPGCSPPRTRTVIARFVTAFTLNEAWVNKLSFKWYGVTSPPGMGTMEAAVQRSTLLPYFAERHAAHERVQLTKVKVNGVTAGAYANFEFELLRSADDLPGGPRLYRGKGAALCSSGRLMV